VASKPWNIKEVNKSCARCVCVCSGGGGGGLNGGRRRRLAMRLR
jgi:hypothetical protein